jgi:hypothetical protein
MKVIRKGSLTASIHNGRLVSFTKDSLEYLHGGGKPSEYQNEIEKKGWQNSEIIMFPVICAVDEFKVRVNQNEYPMDQHGIARVLPFEIKNQTEDSILLVQRYGSSTLVDNPKHKKDSTHPELLEWPFSYTIEKKIELREKKIVVTLTVTNLSFKAMPYMFGWHPAFKVLGSPEGTKITANNKEYSLKEIVKVSQEDMAVVLFGGEKVTYKDDNLGKGFELVSSGFGNVMLGSPNEEDRMFFIEPISQQSVRKKAQEYFYSGNFEYLAPLARKIYSVEIIPF